MDRIRQKQPGDATKVFMPFPRANSTTHINSSIQWNNISAPSEVFCIDDELKNAQLGTLVGARDVLYIRGHCTAGSSFLESSDHNRTITATQLKDALLKGLPLNFPGIIKIYACESARPDKLFWKRFEPFAQRFADEMWEAGYRNCSFYGYDTPVTTYSSGYGNHKWSVEEDWSNVRASVVRIQITPSQLATDSATGDKYSIVLSGETYSLLEIPPESSKAVLAGKKAILENLRLDNLVTGLNRAAGLVYVAQNGVAGFGSLMAAMTGLSDGIIKAASDASLTLSGFADESKTILSHLKRSMTFLLKGHEDLAVKFLTKCGSSAQEMSTQSSKLADRFDKLGDQAIEVLKNTQVEQGRQHEKIEEERRKIAQLQADTAEAKTLSEQLATQRVELKTMYEDAKAKEDKAAERAFALQIVGAIFGAIGSGLNSFTGGMKPGNSAPPPAKSPGAKPTSPATGKAKTPPEKSGDTKGSGDAKGSDAKKSDSKKETEAAAHGSADASNSISDSTDKIASSQQDAAQSYRSEKMKYLDKLLEVEETQRKALADIAKYAELLKSSAQEKQIAETTAAALHQAVGALKSIASTLRDNSFFWELMAQACQKLATPEFLEVITGVKDLPLEERLEIYLEDDFKFELVTYYAQWQALNLVCNEYSAAVFEARAQMLADFQKNPTIEEAQKQAPVLAAQLLADTQKDLKRLDERRAAIDVEKKVLSGAGAATA